MENINLNTTKYTNCDSEQTSSSLSFSNLKDGETKENTNQVSQGKKKLSPYQQFLTKNPKYERYKQSYFDFYDDVKDSTHRIYDW